MWKFIKHEWKFWLTSPMTWIFFFINTLLVMGAVSSDNITLGGAIGSVHKNSPFVVQQFYGTMSLICLLMTTAFMNATAIRDFSSGMYQFVFSSPIKKQDYYLGKFIGAACISLLPLLGVSIGVLIAPFMPWADSNRFGEIIWSGHWQGIISFGIPNTIIASAILYILAIIYRSNIVSFVGAMLLLVGYIVSSGFTRDIEKEWLANILDPFGFRPLGIIAKYMTVDEKNAHGVPLSGAFLLNRIIWVSTSLLALWLCYFKFSFAAKNTTAKKEKQTLETPFVVTHQVDAFVPTFADTFSFASLWYLIKFETKAIVKNPTFIIIVVIGLMNLIASLTSFTGEYGVQQYPVTYEVIDRIKGGFYIFLIAIITFYSGVIVWRDRDAKISEIQDATPIQTSLLFLSKLIALIVSVGLILSCTIILGVIVQTAFGYHRYELGVYFKSLLLIDLIAFAFLVVIALMFHYLINNRYIAYFAFVAFVILNQFIWQVLKISTNMVKFGNTPSVTYSDMNGFGPFVPSTIWFSVYWTLFSILVCYVVFIFYIRGKETGFGHRLTNASNLLNKNKWAISACLLIFIVCSSFVYYNTKVLNHYDTEQQQEDNQVDYEKAYKKYEHIAQPRFYKYNYHIDILPYERSMKASVEAWAKNRTNENITELHFTLPTIPDSLNIHIEGSKLKLDDDRLQYRIYTLAKPLAPNDSIQIKIDLSRMTKGFENEVSFTQLTQNGTFFNNGDFMPMFGYNNNYEISDKNKRAKLKLPKRLRMPILNEDDLTSRANPYVSNDADWVEMNTTITTANDQIAIAPGSLIRSWDSVGKKYFNYHLEQKSLDFYSFISAKYQVKKQRWNGIDLEVYYIKPHEYNVPNMMKSMQKALEYYTQNFGKYYHKQCRIIEFPRYQSFAQAFPGTMPYSEGIGFILDERNVTKDDVDQVFYVVAHEMGHQYWAHQLCGAMMQGSEMMSEGFAQYSALMVMEKEYGKDKMKKFLKYEMNRYLRGRGSELVAENPLVKTEQQSYIHYQKASVVMYYLKEMIGEAKVNEALRSLIDSFAYKEPPYPTSLSAIRSFRKVTPDSLQYLISDLFENITLFSNRIVEAKYKKVGTEYEISITTSSEKFRADSLGKETPIAVNDFIDIGIFATAPDKKNLGKPLLMKRLKLNQKENTFKFRTQELPYQVGIDPYNYLIDRIPDDNLKRVEEQ